MVGQGDDLAGTTRDTTVAIADARNSLIHAGYRLVTAIGVDDLVIVDSADALLVAHRDRVDELGGLWGAHRPDVPERPCAAAQAGRPPHREMSLKLV